MSLHITCACPTPIKGLGCFVVCAGCEGGNARTPQFLCLVHLCEKLGLLYCMSQLGTWVGGWVSDPPPPPGGGGVGHLSVCGYAKILGGWVPELTPPPRVAKQNPGHLILRVFPRGVLGGSSGGT